MTDYDDTEEEGNGTTRRRFLGAAGLTAGAALPTGARAATTDDGEETALDTETPAYRNLPDGYAHVDVRETAENPTIKLSTYEDDPLAAVGINVRFGVASFGFDLSADGVDELIADLEAIREDQADE